jgi:hypothetical protein
LLSLVLTATGDGFGSGSTPGKGAEETMSRCETLCVACVPWRLNDDPRGSYRLKWIYDEGQQLSLERFGEY